MARRREAQNLSPQVLQEIVKVEAEIDLESRSDIRESGTTDGFAASAITRRD
jgi:hypothetical protein